MNESELVEVDLANRNNWTTTHPQLELCPAQIVLRTFPSFWNVRPKDWPLEETHPPGGDGRHARFAAMDVLHI